MTNAPRFRLDFITRAVDLIAGPEGAVNIVGDCRSRRVACIGLHHRHEQDHSKLMLDCCKRRPPPHGTRKADLQPPQPPPVNS